MNQTTHSVLAGMEQNVPSMNTNAFYYVSSQSVVYPPLAKLFVGQIPKTMQTEDVSRIFQQSYPVQRVHIIRDRITGEHKGCAFIYVEASIADQLIAAFHNKITCEGMSHPLQVKVANNPDSKSAFSQPSYSTASYLPAYSPAISMTEVDVSHFPIYPSYFLYTPYPGQTDQPTGENRHRVYGSPEANLFVYNIPSTYGDEDLIRLFERFGTLLSAKVVRDHMSGKSRGFGFVNFSTKSEAETAIREMNRSTVEGRVLTVQVKKPKR